MERKAVESTTMKSVGYDPCAATLEIEFQSGTVYQYFHVPERVYQELMAADSKGEFFNKAIKGPYRYAKV